MLKIEHDTTRPAELTLRLAGEITGPWVGELRRVADAVLDMGTTLVVDLADVAFVDLEGVAVLGRLADRRAVLVNGSPFVTELLKARA